jgi:hypothetical protein
VRLPLLSQVARLLAALRTGLKELANPSAPEPQLPACAKALQLPYAIVVDSRYMAQTSKRLARYTFCVELADGSGKVVVKLCRQGYGSAAQKAWAAAGLAPRVLKEQSLSCGWVLVEMEYLPEGEWAPLDRLPAADRMQALKAAVEVLQHAHLVTKEQDGKAALVHGDARPPNCLVRRGHGSGGALDVRFVDFEW